MKSNTNYKGEGIKDSYDAGSLGKAKSYNPPGSEWLKEYGFYRYASNEFLNGFLGATEVSKNKESNGITCVKQMDVNI